MIDRESERLSVSCLQTLRFRREYFVFQIFRSTNGFLAFWYSCVHFEVAIDTDYFFDDYFMLRENE